MPTEPVAPKRPFREANMEAAKFDARREAYWRGLSEMFAMGFGSADLVHHAPAFAGEINLARFLALYEAYKATLGVAGHIGEFGIYHGTNLLYFAKLSRLFEPGSLTLIHGFDWFKGAQPAGPEIGLVAEGAYAASFEKVSRLVQLQGLHDIIKLHDMDLASNQLPAFLSDFEHIQFRLIVLDCGLYKVVHNCIEKPMAPSDPGRMACSG